jgi:hypothetical protein
MRSTVFRHPEPRALSRVRYRMSGTSELSRPKFFAAERPHHSSLDSPSRVHVIGPCANGHPRRVGPIHSLDLLEGAAESWRNRTPFGKGATRAASPCV